MMNDGWKRSGMKSRTILDKIVPKLQNLLKKEEKSPKIAKKNLVCEF